MFGAVTFANGTSGITGAISSANSLIGQSASNFVGKRVNALENGNYVVQSPSWDNASVPNVGAVTFGSGITGITGVVSPANSLVGSTTDDFLDVSITALSNGNYVVKNSLWDNGAATDAGAVTFGSGTTGVSGAVSAANSLVGSTAGDLIGVDINELSNGNYIVQSSLWDNGAAANAGAVTFGSGTTGVAGTISPAISLVGLDGGRWCRRQACNIST